MPNLLDVTVPLYTFLVMSAVGTSLTVDDFRRVREAPGTVLLASLTHLLCLPLAGILVIELLPLNPFVVAGVLLIAACPGGSIANLYVYLAGANVALAVTLTAISCLAAMVSMPLVMSVFTGFIAGGAAFQAPVLPLLRSLTLFLLLPVLLGMLLRRRHPALIARYDRRLRTGSLLLVVLLIAQILWQAPGGFTLDLAETLQAGALMAVLAVLAGALLGIALRLRPADFWTVTIGMMVQNIALAMTIAVTVYRQPRFATFAVAYFLVQVPIAAGLIILCRRQTASRRHLAACHEAGCRNVPQPENDPPS